MSKPFNEPCGGCGETLAERRCLGCMHEMPTRSPPMTETAKLEALEPCPFCGEHLVAIEGFTTRFQKHMVHSDNGCFLVGTRVIVSEHVFDQERVTAWNTRALSVSRPAVKGLEWGKTSYGTPEVFSVAGVYRINNAINGGWTVMAGSRVLSDTDGRENFPSVEAAKAAAQSDFEQRILSSLSPPTGGATHRHVKRGSEYELIGIGKVQAENWREHGLDASWPTSVDMREIAIYRSIDDGSLWARPLEEFRDGRFVALTKKEGQ